MAQRLQPRSLRKLERFTRQALVDRRSCHACWLVFRNRLKAPRKLASDSLGWHHDRVRALLGKVSEAVSIDENKAVAKKPFGEILNDRRVELVDEIVADEVVDHNRIIFAQRGVPGGVAEGLRMLLAAFPDMSAAVERLVGEEDCVVAKVRMVGNPPSRGLFSTCSTICATSRSRSSAV